MFKIFDTKYKDRVRRALKIINMDSSLTYLQKTCICKLYLENNIKEEIKISPEYFKINKSAYLKLLDKIFYQDIVDEIEKSPPYYGAKNLGHKIILKEVD